MYPTIGKRADMPEDLLVMSGISVSVFVFFMYETSPLRNATIYTRSICSQRTLCSPSLPPLRVILHLQLLTLYDAPRLGHLAREVGARTRRLHGRGRE